MSNFLGFLILKYFLSLGIHLIYNNILAAKSLLMYGSLDQKNKYLKGISTGEIKACFCYSEKDNGVDEARFNVIAKFDTNQSLYILNGKKSWTSILTNDENNANIKNNAVFVVFAKTENLSTDLKSNNTLNAFLVDKNTRGLTIKKQLKNYNGLNLYEIEFNNVELSSDCLLGSTASGHEISNKISENSYYFVGALCIGL